MHLFPFVSYRKTLALLLSGAMLFGMAAQAVSLDPEQAVQSTVTSAVPEKVSAVQTTDQIELDGSVVRPEVYKIASENYFKLRDVAYLLRNTDSRFGVEWDKADNRIRLTTGSVYKTVGGELSKTGGTEAAISTVDVQVNGTTVSMKAYNIGGNNYFRLRDIGGKLGFSVTYNDDTDTVQMDSGTVRYTVRFDENGHGTAPSKVTNLTKGAKLTAPDVQSVSGYTLAGWYRDSACTTAWNFASDTVNGNLTLYAKWTKISSNTTETGGDGKSDGVLTILVDPGHGGTDSGASSVEAGVYEKDLCLRAALKLRDLLTASGAKVLMTRTTDVSLPASKRMPYITNNAKILDLVVVIHLNSSDASSARGSEMLAPSSAQETSGVSKSIDKLFIEQYTAMGLNNRGVKERPNLYMIKAATKAGVPIAYSEFCFISNSSDYAYVNTDEGLQKEAQAMCNAILQYYQTAQY